MNGYSGIDADATLGGAMTATAETNLGRVTQLRFAQDFGYVPTLVLGAPEFMSLDLTTPVPDVAAVSSGYLDQRSWSSNSVVNLDCRWTSRQTTLVAAAYSSPTYLDDLGADTRTRFANPSTVGRSVAPQVFVVFIASAMRTSGRVRWVRP